MKDYGYIQEPSYRHERNGITLQFHLMYSGLSLVKELHSIFECIQATSCLSVNVTLSEKFLGRISHELV